MGWIDVTWSPDFPANLRLPRLSLNRRLFLIPVFCRRTLDLGLTFRTTKGLPSVRFERKSSTGEFRISRCKGWRHLPPVGLLPSLRQLHLWNMGDLEYLIYDDKKEDAEGKNPYFPALEKLFISNCPLLVVDGKQFTSLHELTLLEMETLPGWLPSLPNLQTLELSWCNNFVSLPEWMGDLKSLQEIRLRQCNSLASIPDCVLHLTSLQRLEVEHCEELYRRYNKESGEDWHQISHIPNVSVKRW